MSDFTWNSLQFAWLWNDFENSARELWLNNETENWKLNKIDVLRSIQGMQDMSFPRVQFSFFFFSGEHAPELPYIIRTFGADSTLVSPVTLVLNVQLQKTPYLDKMNDDTEKQ